MANVVLGWDDVWLSWFAKADDKSKANFLKEVDIVGMIRSSTSDVQIEVLQMAPDTLKEYLSPYLHPSALEFLLPHKANKLKLYQSISRSLF